MIQMNEYDKKVIFINRKALFNTDIQLDKKQSFSISLSHMQHDSP